MKGAISWQNWIWTGGPDAVAVTLDDQGNAHSGSDINNLLTTDAVDTFRFTSASTGFRATFGGSGIELGNRAVVGLCGLELDDASVTDLAAITFDVVLKNNTSTVLTLNPQLYPDGSARSSCDVAEVTTIDEIVVSVNTNGSGSSWIGLGVLWLGPGLIFGLGKDAHVGPGWQVSPAESGSGTVSDGGQLSGVARPARDELTLPILAAKRATAYHLDTDRSISLRHLNRAAGIHSPVLAAVRTGDAEIGAIYGRLRSTAPISRGGSDQLFGAVYNIEEIR